MEYFIQCCQICHVTYTPHSLMQQKVPLFIIPLIFVCLFDPYISVIWSVSLLLSEYMQQALPFSGSPTRLWSSCRVELLKCIPHSEQLKTSRRCCPLCRTRDLSRNEGQKLRSSTAVPQNLRTELPPWAPTCWTHKARLFWKARWADALVRRHFRFSENCGYCSS